MLGYSGGYQDLVTNCLIIAQLSVLIEILVVPAGVEPAISWMRTRRPGPLDDETSYFYYNTKFVCW